MRYQIARIFIKLALRVLDRTSIMVFPDGTWVLPAKGLTVTYAVKNTEKPAVFKNNRAA